MNHERECFFRCMMISIVEREDPKRLTNWFKPHIDYVNNESLTRFYRFLITQPASAIFVIEDVVMDCYSNERLYQLLLNVADKIL